MTEYVVSWIIDITAEDEVDAAQQAWDILNDPERLGHMATVFNVQEGETVGMISPGVDVDVKLYENCTCPTEVAAGLRDGSLCPYCIREMKNKEIPF